MHLQKKFNKKLMLLGGSHYLLPAIEAAHALGAYVITADYLPDNIAHRYSDEYVNVSIVEKDAVLAAAREAKIDGIMSYATDPGVACAAYVAETLGLPTSPYESVDILQNKGKFRRFLTENGFNVPHAGAYTSAHEACEHASEFEFPVIVKPTDSAGSKGVRKVESADGLGFACEHALEHSISGELIVEEFIEADGFASGSDSFSVDGELVFCSFDNQLFDEDAPNPFTPVAHVFPSSMPMQTQSFLHDELQRLASLLGMQTTIYNIETRLGTNATPYIMEMSPRAGGNRIAEVLRFATGQDLIDASVKAALAMEVEGLHEPHFDGFWSITVIHSEHDGVFESLFIDPSIEDCVFEKDLWVSPGESVHGFTGANQSLGTLVLHTQTRERIDAVLRDLSQLVIPRVSAF